MLDKKGSTLIESLFALEIFVCVLVVYVGLFQSVFKQELKMKSIYQEITEKEGDVLYQEDFVSLIEKVLH
ncbi:MAG: hypothetical protein RR630_00605 [Coprobacillus sp.]